MCRLARFETFFWAWQNTGADRIQHHLLENAPHKQNKTGCSGVVNARKPARWPLAEFQLRTLKTLNLCTTTVIASACVTDNALQYDTGY